MSAFQQYAKNIFASPSRDAEETNSFVFTFRKFINPSDLFELWIQKLKEIDAADARTQSNMMDFLFLWFGKSYYLDFPRGKERLKILNCIDTVFPCRRNEFKLFALRMNKNRHNSISYSKRGNRSTFKLNGLGTKLFADTPTSLLPTAQGSNDSISSTNSTTSNYQDDESFNSQLKNVELPAFMKVQTDAIAQSFTLEASALFLNLNPIEFLTKTGWNSQSKVSAKHLDGLIAKFNEISGWVTTEIVTQPNKNLQVEIAERMIRIAKKCEMLNNFDSCLAILSGLNSFAVQRLKTLWSLIPEKAKADFNYLEGLMSPLNNFKRYSEEISIRRGAKVPYIGLLIRDFTFLAENEFIREEKVNDDALKMMGKRMNLIKELQADLYELSVDVQASLSFLKSFKIISNEEELYEWSLHSEPSAALWAPVPEEFYHPEDESNTETSASETASQSAQSIESEPVVSSSPSILSPIALQRYRSSTGSLEELRIREKRETKEVREKNRRRRESSFCSYKEEFVPILCRMEHSAEQFFNNATSVNKYKGTINTAGHRSLLIRNNAIGVDFVQEAKDLFQFDKDEDRNTALEKFVYDIWFSVGKNDLKIYKKDIPLEEEEDLIVSGLVFTAYEGWNRVLLIDGNLHRDNFFMQLNAEKTNRGSGPGSCWAFAGYLSGWTTGSYGQRVDVCEITCGNSNGTPCTFIAAPTETLQKHVDLACEKLSISSTQKGKIFEKPIPSRASTDKNALKRVDKNYLTQGFNKLKLKIKEKQTSVYPDTPFEVIPQVETKCIEMEAALFGNLVCDPMEGSVGFEKRQEAHIFVRGAALSVEFIDHFKDRLEVEKGDLATKFAAQIVMKLGIALGRADLKSLSTSDRLGAGNMFLKAHFLVYGLRNGGWGKGMIMPASTIKINTQKKLEHVCLRCNVYNGFESEAWIASEKSMRAGPNSIGESPTCLLTAGYISGWMSEAFSTNLEVVEVSCRKRGRECCTFLVTSKSKMEDEVKKFLAEIQHPSKINDLMTLALLRMRDTPN
eukprot:TRINITY_DN280_c0_g1_i1.p1 TRINITY_DN280_c0_g1~~TRINITY_DN280_c0_g1_i1.p1  ORF type:complete len:1022 (-),score=377.69 TRINITY_DN280_c0_g1_i1:131-3196(-)